jgi:hypothetical protein
MKPATYNLPSLSIPSLSIEKKPDLNRFVLFAWRRRVQPAGQSSWLDYTGLSRRSLSSVADLSSTRVGFVRENTKMRGRCLHPLIAIPADPQQHIRRCNCSADMQADRR